MVSRLIVVHNNFQEGFGQSTDQNRSFKKVKGNGKALGVSIQMNWTLKGLKLLKGTN